MELNCCNRNPSTASFQAVVRLRNRLRNRPHSVGEGRDDSRVDRGKQEEERRGVSLEPNHVDQT